MDLAQRMAIARSGRFHVWSLTWDDVDAVTSEQHDPAFPEGASALNLIRQMDSAGAPMWDGMHARTAFDWFLFRLGDGRKLNWKLHARAWLATRMNARNGQEEEVRDLRHSLLRPGDEFAATADGGNGDPTFFRAGVARQGAIGYVVQGDVREMRSGLLDGLMGSFRLFDEAAAGDRWEWKRSWRRFLQWFNILQFGGPLEFVSSSGLRDGVYGAMLLEDLPTPGLNDLFAFADSSLREFLEELEAAARMLPSVGFELSADDGEIIATAELAWEETLLAVLLGSEWNGRSKFEERGWKVYLASAVMEWKAELIEALPGDEC